MLIAQPPYLLRPKTLGQCLLDIDAGQPLREAVKHISIGIAVLHTARHALVHFVQISGHQDQQLAVIRTPATGVRPEGCQPLTSLCRRPAHDVGDRLTQLECLLNIACIPGRQIEGRALALRLLGLLHAPLFITVQIEQIIGRLDLRLRLLMQVIGQLHLDAIQRLQRRRQTPIGQQGPDILIALDRNIVTLAINRAVALKLIEQQHTGCIFGNRRLGQHGCY